MDRRLMCYGTDQRRTTLSPADQARAEALVAKRGGILEINRELSGELVVSWREQNGATVRAMGENALSVVEQMCRDAMPGETL